MLHISIHNAQKSRQMEHAAGPLEFGRVPQRGTARVVLEDPHVSRDQMRVRERSGGRLEVENLSQRTPIYLNDGTTIAVGKKYECSLPVRLTVGTTNIDFDVSSAVPIEPAFDSWRTVMQPARVALNEGPQTEMFRLPETESALTPHTLAHWFETLVSVQRAAAGSREFYDETARAVVSLVGLDRGMVLLRRSILSKNKLVVPRPDLLADETATVPNSDWEVVASHATAAGAESVFSRTILRRMVEERRTFYRPTELSQPTCSLLAVEAIVVAPIFDPRDEVVGAVYGLRAKGTGAQGPGIKPLEAQLVQVLAAAVGAGLERLHREAEATRNRIQFEQFFSAGLARELERDPTMLEGRDCIVTSLFCDIRNFSGLSERLGPAETCRLVGDVMERLTGRIVEHEGVLVDYIGDGLLAMWNAPADQPNHAALACRAAQSMLAELPGLCETWHSLVGAPLGLGIGINTGPARVGNMGSLRKFKYGPLGHSINLASRVEGATKHLGVPVLITGSTRVLLPEDFLVRRLCRARLMGMAAPTELYELSVDVPTPQWESQREAFEKALDLYESGDWAETCDALQNPASGLAHLQDPPSRMLLARAQRCLSSPPAAFDGVVEFGQK
jgi:adenylate cyclase